MPLRIKVFRMHVNALLSSIEVANKKQEGRRLPNGFLGHQIKEGFFFLFASHHNDRIGLEILPAGRSPPSINDDTEFLIRNLLLRKAANRRVSIHQVNRFIHRRFSPFRRTS